MLTIFFLAGLSSRLPRCSNILSVSASLGTGCTGPTGTETQFSKRINSMASNRHSLQILQWYFIAFQPPRAFLNDLCLQIPMVIHVYHPYRQPDAHNHCLPLNGRCSHICLPAPQLTANSAKTSCACPKGLKLDKDNLNCIQDRELDFLFFSIFSFHGFFCLALFSGRIQVLTKEKPDSVMYDNNNNVVPKLVTSNSSDVVIVDEQGLFFVLFLSLPRAGFFLFLPPNFLCFVCRQIFVCFVDFP